LDAEGRLEEAHELEDAGRVDDARFEERSVFRKRLDILPEHEVFRDETPHGPADVVVHRNTPKLSRSGKIDGARDRNRSQMPAFQTTAAGTGPHAAVAPSATNCESSIWVDSTPTNAKCLIDRKSTRLNSSHSQTSYAVFCLK